MDPESQGLVGTPHSVTQGACRDVLDQLGDYYKQFSVSGEHEQVLKELKLGKRSHLPMSNNH